MKVTVRGSQNKENPKDVSELNDVDTIIVPSVGLAWLYLLKITIQVEQ